MSFVKLQDGRSTYALDSIRLRNQREASSAPQANTVELYMKEGELRQIDENGVDRSVTADFNNTIPDRSISNVKIELDSITSNEIADNTITINKLDPSILNSFIPKGSISAFVGTVAPNGWLLCHGQSLSQTEYSELFAVTGTAYGNGTTGIVVGTPGGSRFNLPDFRGQFLRGVDGGVGQDPDRLSRTASAAGGNTGDAIGSSQTDQMQGHRHAKPDSLNFPYLGNAFSGDGQIDSSNFVGPAERNSTTANSGLPVNDGTNGTPRTGLETRPKNIYVNYIIKV